MKNPKEKAKELVARYNVLQTFIEDFSNENAIECAEIAEEFAIGFAEWTSFKYKYLEEKGWYRNSYELELGIFKSSKQLLEIYKKEKGL